MKPSTEHPASTAARKEPASEAFLFDFGGTLDTRGCHWGRFLWHAYRRQQVPVGEEAFRAAYIHAERTLGRNPIIQPGYTFRRMLETKLRIEFEYLTQHGLAGSAQFPSDDMQAAVLDDVYDKVKAIAAESRGVLLRLKERSRLALVSNFYGNLHTVLDELNLSGLFETVVESAVCGVRKPDPRIFSLAVEALGTNPGDTTVVGDSYDKDIAPAHSLGCRTVWLKGEGWTDDQPDGTAADRIIGHLAELLPPPQ